MYSSAPITSPVEDKKRSGVTERLDGLPPFVTVKGGAYFFLPGIRALRFIASRP